MECRCEGACVKERTKNVMVRGVDLAGSGTVMAVEKRGKGLLQVYRQGVKETGALGRGGKHAMC